MDVNKPVQLPRRVISKARARTPATSTDRNQAIPKESPLFLNNEIRNLRSIGKIVEAVRKLAQGDGTVSTAVYSYVQVAMSGYEVVAYNTATHQYDEQGTALAKSVLASFDTLHDYTQGYSDKQTMDALVETLLREVVLTGAVAGELVLDKGRFPDHLNVIAYETLKRISRGDGTSYPAQEGQGDDIPLDIPTFWVAESHKDANRTYAVSMMEAAINNAFYYTEFIEDMRRVMRRSGHSRLVITLNAESISGMAPTETRNDPAKMKAFLESAREQVEEIVSSLEPEDALVTFDSASSDMLTSENVKADYSDLVTAISGILATSLKSHPSILGLRIGGSQSLSNTESLVFLKNATAIQRPVQDLLSRAMTLSVRLYGSDVYVKFRFKPINLRPEDELEAFKTMRQQRILSQLSLGFISDEEAAVLLGTGPRPPGAPKLSGTMFMETKSTNRAEEASPNADPQGRALQPDAPDKAGGESQ